MRPRTPCRGRSSLRAVAERVEERDEVRDVLVAEPEIADVMIDGARNFRRWPRAARTRTDAAARLDRAGADIARVQEVDHVLQIREVAVVPVRCGAGDV